MSYASVVANNPPLPHQSQADDPASTSWSSTSAFDPQKINPFNSKPKHPPTNGSPENRRLRKAEEEGLELWATAKEYLLRPSVAGGLVGIVNVGLLVGAGRAFYVKPEYRHDPVVISSTAAAALLLGSVEGYFAEKFHQSPEGQEAERRAREEGSIIYQHIHEIILRPSYLGGFVGIVNVGVLGAVGTYGYKNWHQDSWDQSTVAAIAVGIFTLLGAESFAAVQYSKTPEGRKARQKAKEEGSAVYKHLHEAILRPGVLGGIFGLVNTGALATVAYCGYMNWDQPSWDKRTVSAIVAGILALWAGEGFIAENFRESHNRS